MKTKKSKKGDENQESDEENHSNQNQKIKYVGVPIYTQYDHQQTAQANQRPQYSLQPPPPQHYSHIYQPNTTSNLQSQVNPSNFTTNPLTPNNQYFFKTF